MSLPRTHPTPCRREARPAPGAATRRPGAAGRRCERVIGIDIDASRLSLAAHNARVYDVSDRVQWLHGDFMALAPHLRADVVFLSPPWGGPRCACPRVRDPRPGEANRSPPSSAHSLVRWRRSAHPHWRLARSGGRYTEAEVFDIDTMMGGLDGSAILRAALRVAPNVAYFLPKNADLRQVQLLATEAGVQLRWEKCLLNDHIKGLMAYFGFEEEQEADEAEAEEAEAQAVEREPTGTE